MINIIHFISDANIGGAGTLLCSQIKNTDTKRFRISVALPQRSALSERLLPLPCTLIRCEHGADASFSLASLVEDYRIIRERRPDIVHSHASLSSRVAATMLGIPCRIFTRHCTVAPVGALRSALTAPLIGAATRMLSTSVIATSRSARDGLTDMGCDPKMIDTVINGAEPLEILCPSQRERIRRSMGIEESDFVISMVARLEGCKGHATFIRAAAACCRRYEGLRFLIVGDGSQRQGLESEVERLGLSEHVIFTGFVKNVSEIFNITDLNVNCSLGTETSCLALSEGMSLGIPCIASDFSGNSYIVRSGENGLLFPVGDHEALAACIIRMYLDRELYARCSEGSRKRFREELNAVAMTERMMSIYQREYKKRAVL